MDWEYQNHPPVDPSSPFANTATKRCKFCFPLPTVDRKLFKPPHAHTDSSSRQPGQLIWMQPFSIHPPPRSSAMPAETHLR